MKPVKATVAVVALSLALTVGGAVLSTPEPASASAPPKYTNAYLVFQGTVQAWPGRCFGKGWWGNITVGLNLAGEEWPNLCVIANNFSGAGMAGTDLSYSRLMQNDMSGANLTGANLTRANLSYSKLMQSNMSGANLTRANLSNCNLNLTNLAGANLTGANLNLTNLAGANLTGANLAGADLSSGLPLSESGLSTNLTGANLTRANLIGANLANVDLTSTNLSGANMTGAKFYPSALKSGTIFSKTTVCPNGKKYGSGGGNC